MADAARTALAYPEALVVERDTLDEQSAAIAAGLPRRPLVLGGCCCCARRRDPRARRRGTTGSPSSGSTRTATSTRPRRRRRGTRGACRSAWRSTRAACARDDVALVGARDLDPPEVDYVAEHGIDDDLGAGARRCDAAYVALDVDVLEPGAGPVLHARARRPDGRARSRRSSRTSHARTHVAGLGITGLAPGADPRILARFAAAAGL